MSFLSPTNTVYFKVRKIVNEIPYILISVMNNYEHDDRVFVPLLSAVADIFWRGAEFFVCDKIYIRSTISTRLKCTVQRH